jgi:iron(III) transport system permease protein
MAGLSSAGRIDVAIARLDRPSVRLSARFLAWCNVERVVWLFLFCVVLVVAILPLLTAFSAGFYTETRVGLSGTLSLKAIRDVYLEADYYLYLLTALLIAALVTLISTLIGLAMAVLIARTDVRGESWLDFLVIMPLFVSPFIGLLSWITLGSQKTGFLNVAWRSLAAWFGFDAGALIQIWSFGGVVWVMFLFFCPFAYLFTVGGLRGMDASLEEAARMHGASSWHALRTVTLPMAMPAILSSALLIFVLAAETYTIPGIIGANAGFTTLPWKIFQDSVEFPVHRAHAAAAGSMLLLVTIIGLWLQRHMTRKAERFVTVTGKGFRGNLLPLGRLKWPVMLFFGSYILCADILPLGALVVSSFMKYSAATISAGNFTLQNYAGVFGLPELRQAIWNTIVLAVLSGMICVIFGFLISFMETRRGGLAARALAFAGVLPVAVPGLVYGIGLLWVYLRTPLYGSIWVLLMAFVAKFLPYGILVSRTGILQVNPDLEKSARLSGASPLYATRTIMMPILKPTLIAVLFFVMISSIKEMSAAVLLFGEHSQVLSVLTWQHVDDGEYQFASALGVIQTVIMIGLVVATRVLFRVKLERAISAG